MNVKELVNTGVKWADETIPDWREHVDPDIFDVGSPINCFLGQYWLATHSEGYGNYFDARNHFSGFDADEDELSVAIDWAYDRGFTDTGAIPADLNAAWQEKFAELGLLKTT